MHTFCHREEKTIEHNILGKSDRIQIEKLDSRQMESEISIEEVTMRVTEHENDKFSLCIFLKCFIVQKS